MNSVIKGVSYTLAHVPDMITYSGTTQTMERSTNPDSEYLKELKNHIRSYEDAVSYPPHQAYIGNITPEELGTISQPWYEHKNNKCNTGQFGEIIPQEEFYVLMKMSDAFDLVGIEETYLTKALDRLKTQDIYTEDILGRVKGGCTQAELEAALAEGHPETLYADGKAVGYVKAAHDVDINLNAHTMLENLAAKAGSVHAMLHLVKNAGIEKAEVEYVIDCCEEACGDMNQRGGGNFAKAAAEVVGLSNATGSDTRGFCAAPAHAIVEAAALVSAGVYKNVVVTAGGCTAKLGMNGKDHLKKGLPILEDVIGNFAVLISENDGINPEIVLSVVGRHTVGTGSSPQAVISCLTADPLERAGLKITDVDKYAPEMQNPEITKSAGAGDVPLANYKMIGALAVMKKEIEKKDLGDFVTKHGMIGWAPTQGHIPSGVPFIGFAKNMILNKEIEKVMIVGKGSLFLGRLTNLFDGVSFLVSKNSGAIDQSSGVSKEEIRSMIAESMEAFANSMMEK